MASPSITARRRHARLRRFTMQTGVIIGYWVAWELLARAGFFYEGVIPSSVAILQALYHLLLDPELYRNAAVTVAEVAAALLLGGGAGLLFGLLGGVVRPIGEAYEPLVHYAAPTPKIVFLPILLLLFGVGVSTKIALGGISAFFPMAIAMLAGVREIDPVLLRVGRSFRLGPAQMALKVYLPALRAPMLTGLRLGFGLAVVGVLLAEIKLSNIGLGFMAIQFYNHFEIAALYALLLVIFLLSGAVNGLIDRLTPRASG